MKSPAVSNKSPAHSENQPGWFPYNLDQRAQNIVLAHRDKRDVLNESHKMRMAVAYGLERFWGEHLRLQRQDKDKARFWKDAWEALVEVMATAGVPIPNDTIPPNENESTRAIRQMSQKLWNLPSEYQRVTLAVLTQLCDCIVWWTQRYKKRGD